MYQFKLNLHILLFLLILWHNFNKDSSESSLDDDPYLDEQDQMTDQQEQTNKASSVVPGAGNTLSIKSNVSRLVKY